MKATEKLFRKLVPVEEEIHINFVINHQENGGWGEEIKDVGKNVSSPLVTSQMIIGLLPYLRIDKFKHLREKIIQSTGEGIQFIIDNFRSSGWSDHSGGYAIVDATGAAVTAIINSLLYGIIVPKSQEYIYKAIKFLAEGQNPEDGGWSIRRGGQSKIQYTYWTLKALHACSKFGLELKESDINKNIDLGLDWLRKNFEAKEDKGFSIAMSGEIGAIATTFGIELFEDFSIDYDKKKVIDNLVESQSKHGCWEIQTDATTVGRIPRRVYVLNDIPRILECFALLDVKFDSDLFIDVSSSLKDLEIKKGGFKHKTSDQCPIGWFTAEVLKILPILINKFNSEFEKYEKDERVVLITKRHSFSKGVLMIGRFRPPHIGHYFGLQAILYSDENEFSLPLEVLKELIDIDKVFLGIARYDINRENPFTVGEVREIWRQIIDNDHKLERKSNIIEIVTCPARRDLTNVVDAIDELTYNRESIIVISGNDRIIEQCNINKIENFQFRRREKQLCGAEIRDIISKIDFENLDECQELLESLRKKLHPVAFQVMMREGLFKRAQKYINAT